MPRPACRICLMAIFAWLANACVGHDLYLPDDGPQTVSDSRPVDMIFQVRISPLANSCDYDQLPDDYLTLVDILGRDDGLVNLSHQSAWIPLPDRTKGISRQAGNVWHSETWTSSLTGDGYERLIWGHVTPDSLDLVIDSEDEKWNVGSHSLCRKAVRLTGRPWPISDPKAVQGFYTTAVEDHGRLCPDQSLPVRPIGPGFRAILSVEKYRDGLATYTLNDRMAIDAPLPSPGGRIGYGLDHNGRPDLRGQAFMLHDSGHFTEMLASMSGSLIPPAVDLELRLAYRESGKDDEDQTTCGDSLTVIGQKRLPSTTAVDNDWRGAFKGQDRCAGQAIDDQQAIRLISQGNRQVDLWVNGAAIALVRDGQRLHKEVVLAIDGSVISMDGVSNPKTPAGFTKTAVLKIEGTLAPPKLDYTVDFQQLENGKWCGLNYRVTARPRFVQ